MDFIADILLAAGALAAAFYCYVLSRKLNKLSSLDQELGGAIAVLSQQVDEMTATLGSAKDMATSYSEQLESKISDAQAAVDRIDLMMAALHDLPTPSEAEDVTEAVEENDVTVFLRTPSRQGAVL